MRTISSNQDLHSLDVNRDSKFLAAQVGAFFFAGIVFCIAAQAFYVYINIFRAYERPVLWAFLCSVPLRGLKLNVDQILAEAAEAADGEEKERRTPESNTGVAGGKRLKYLNILILAYILYGTMEKETWADLFVVLAYCFAGICVAWCAIFVVALSCNFSRRSMRAAHLLFHSFTGQILWYWRKYYTDCLEQLKTIFLQKSQRYDV